MRLFRSISVAEYENLIESSAFRQTEASLEGKWFAEFFDDAVEWGIKLGHGYPFWVVEIDIFNEIADNLFRIDLLDGIGPARYAELNHLKSMVIIDAILIELT